MSDAVITVEGIGKRYTLEHKGSQGGGLRHVLNDALSAPFRLFKKGGAETETSSTQEDFWALKDVSFQVNRGDVVGLVGRNGAGKSTLLKVLSRIIEPTEGRISIRGRVASLLEVGTGFHPELTGRENIFLNGAILGMRRTEIKAKFDEIVAFAEVERFLDTPVKRYSSGMYVRLAFAVAAHLEPEILIIDEVLAVGDAQFQKKCLGKMEEVSRQQGRTVFFVSHNMATILSLCTRGILMAGGQKSFDGTAREATDLYLQSGGENLSVVRWEGQSGPGSDEVRLSSVAVTQNGELTGEVAIDEDFLIEIQFVVLREDKVLYSNIQLATQGGTDVLSSVNWPAANLEVDPLAGKALAKGTYRASCRVPGNFLNEGIYSVSVFLLNFGANAEATARSAVRVRVFDTGAMRKDGYYGPWGGVVRPRLAWKTENIF
jgi:lipopolysaccharide transport system ATP-binding protein